MRLEAEDGRVGWGEMAPLGAFYDPSFAEGARAGIALLAPVVLGADPRRPATLHRLLDLHLTGHPYAKSAIDMACWDVAARLAGAPLVDLLGGRDGDSVPLYRSISHLSLGTPVGARTHTVDFHRWVTVANGSFSLVCDDGVLTLQTDDDGLGVTVDAATFGEPVFDLHL